MKYNKVLQSFLLFCLLLCIIFLLNYTIYYNWKKTIRLPSKYPDYLDYPIPGYFNESITDKERVYSPVNPREIPILIDSVTGLDNLYLVFIIKSTVEQRNIRDFIRKSWANKNCSRPGRKWSHFFTFGNTDSEENFFKLSVEADEFNDILLFDYKEHYLNNSYKFFYGLNYAVNQFREAKFYALMDDDFLVNQRNYIQYLDRIPLSKYDEFIGGHLMGINNYPVHKPNSRDYVSKDIYPYNSYAPYVSGGHVTLSGPLAKRVMRVFFYTRIFPIDDALLGLILAKIRVKIANIPEIYVEETEIPRRGKKNFISIHSQNRHVPTKEKFWNQRKDTLCLR